MKNNAKLLLSIVSILFILLILKQNASAMIIQNTAKPVNSITTSLKGINQEKKVIYLTFDDGPSIITSKVLDILKKNEVKATFFIIGNQITGFEDVVKKEFIMKGIVLACTPTLINLSVFMRVEILL